MRHESLRMAGHIDNAMARSFKDVYAGYKRGDYSSPEVRDLYRLVAMRVAADKINWGSAWTSSPAPNLGEGLTDFSLDLRFVARKDAQIAKLGDSVGFYHYLAGIIVLDMEWEPNPTHGFSDPCPTLVDLSTADCFYNKGLDIFSRFATDWRWSQIRLRTARTDHSDEARHNVFMGVNEDITHIRAFINGTKAIVLSAWKTFSEREDINDSERRFAQAKVAYYEAEIASDKELGVFDEGLAENPESRPSPSAIGTLSFFPGRAE